MSISKGDAVFYLPTEFSVGDPLHAVVAKVFVSIDEDGNTITSACVAVLGESGYWTTDTAHVGGDSFPRIEPIGTATE